MLTIAEKLTSFDLVYPNFEWWSWYRITYILFWTCGWWQGVIAFDFDGICCVRWREFDYLPMVSFGASAFKTLDRRPCFGAVDRIYVSLGFHCAIVRLSSWCGCWDRQCTMLRLLSSLSSRKCGALLGIVELGLRRQAQTMESHGNNVQAHSWRRANAVYDDPRKIPLSDLRCLCDSRVRRKYSTSRRPYRGFEM